MTPNIIIVAPYPDIKYVSEGWMSRIRAVDRIFITIPRAYINFGSHHTAKKDGKPIRCGENVVQYNLNTDEKEHQQIFESLLENVVFVYVHTVHLAINVRQWLPTGKFIVDIHGIVPEEEIMLGRPEEAQKYLPVEAEVLKYCRKLVCVTRSMKDHLLKKYPWASPEFIILPIYEKYNKSISSALEKCEIDSIPRVVYSGGSQVWQNVEYMFELVKRTLPYVAFTFLTHDTILFEEMAQKYGVADKVNIRKVSKQELPDIYRVHDFGFILRDDNPVNTVSCPTKLSEYMDFGVVPIVKYKLLGDFERYGYNYITDDEFREFLIPDQTCREIMVKRNHEAIEKLIDQYEKGAQMLLLMIK